MSDSPHHPEAPGNPFELPARTTPTWEVEILLSGATVFALFQLYGFINESVIQVVSGLASDARGMASAMLVYVQAGVLALALGFVLHLLLRAFWVGAVGLRSVDPTGKVRQSISIGPAQQRLVADAWDNLPRQAAALDDWATLTFALALGLAKLMGLLMLIAATLNLAGYGIHFGSGQRVSVGMGMLLLAVLLMGPMSIATWLDNRAGKRKSTPPNWVAKVLGWYSLTGMLANQNLALQVLTQRASGERSRARGMLAVFALIFTLMALVSLSMIWQQGALTRLFSNSQLRSMDGQEAALRGNHYLSLQNAGQVQVRPYLQAEVITGPYAKLRIPFFDDWHAEALRKCAEKHGDAGDADAWRFDGRAAKVLACVAAAQPITLDGKPLTTPWMLIDDRREGRSDFVIMIDVRGLPRGAHVLTIAQPPAETAEAGDKPPRPWRIPFWT